MRPDDGPGPGGPGPLAAVPDAIYRLDAEGRFTYVNAAAEQFLEHPAEELVGRRAGEVFPYMVESLAQEKYLEVLADGRPREFEYYYEPQGRWYEVRVFADPPGVSVFFRDVDQRHRTEAAREAELRRLSSVLEALPSATVLVDEDFRILTGNRRWAATLAVPSRSVGVPGTDYRAAVTLGVSPTDSSAIEAGLRRLLDPAADGAVQPFEHEFPRSTPTTNAWYRLQAARVDGAARAVVTHTDITERVRGEQALAWRARHDDLTGLPNRATLLDAMSEALAAVPEEGGVALLMIDLDGFKTINDSLGHGIGDALLRQVGDRLTETLRPGDSVGRLGGDQFVVLARRCDDSEAAALAFRLQEIFVRPFVATGISVPLSASIGVAVARPGMRDGHELLSDADAAMFAAKSMGRDRVHLFSPGLREAARWRLEVATRLRDEAIDQLVVHYQPIVRLDTGAVEGVEALVRWQHPERGLLPPDSFLSVAEETGQVIPITRWLLVETTRRAVEWAAQGLPLRMSVNISARHFSAETLVRDVRTALHESGLPAEQLVLELTETSVAEDPTRAEDQLSVLRRLGVRVAIDDFGTGWSSLAQLFALPVGTLKIDRSLLTAAEQVTGGDGGAVLAAIVGLTRTLGIRSVAEGVETVDHLRMVRAAGCDLAQGWLLGHPMPADEVPRYVRAVQEAGGDLCALAVAGTPVTSLR
ncbi:bifunctional diguanylate cyclase/phosphodiesterase [Blastococcus sp. TF02A-30]|uniref:putative bifunctional diguanylate cyclase/phosphodiesterase n=1 Tax=Blastococcus sp. TF02A-30 TaxID=2250580 RepID=UPI000DE9E6B2|nr:EAL domain-containing protein [Blastococcus sp. TF02A-30]RBY92593.1 GGDEF domain-containing protein [Blastococcus sp. TF02A-30]